MRSAWETFPVQPERKSKAVRRASARREAGRMERPSREGLLIISLIDDIMEAKIGYKTYLNKRIIYIDGCMGTVTLSLKPEVEKLLRQLAKAKHKSKKGAMAKVVEEALQTVTLSDERK